MCCALSKNPERAFRLAPSSGMADAQGVGSAAIGEDTTTTPVSDDELEEWEIDDEIVHGRECRPGIIVGLSAHGHLRREMQTVRVRWSDGWGAEQEICAADPLLRRRKTHVPTPATNATVVGTSDRTADYRLHGHGKTLRRTPKDDEVMEDERDTFKKRSRG